MANWHLVVAYDERAAEWLTDQGYQCPAVRPGNRLPTLHEIETAAQALCIGADAPLLIDGVGSADSFTVRGDLVLELLLLRKLSEQSGQLWVYPDCGSPAIVVDPATDPEAGAAAWLASLSAEDCWAAFLGKVSSTDPDAASGRDG